MKPTGVNDDQAAFERLIEFECNDLLALSDEEVMEEFRGDPELHKLGEVLPLALRQNEIYRQLADIGKIAASAASKQKRLAQEPHVPSPIHDAPENSNQSKREEKPRSWLAERSNASELASNITSPLEVPRSSRQIRNDLPQTSITPLLKYATLIWTVICMYPAIFAAWSLILYAGASDHTTLTLELSWLGLALGGSAVAFNNVYLLVSAYSKTLALFVGIAVGSLTCVCVLHFAILEKDQTSWARAPAKTFYIPDSR